MMTKYVSVDEAIYRLQKMADIDNQPRAIRRAAKYLAKFAEECPADVEEVRHGEWLESNKWQPCSECHKRGKRSWKYCPNCGAKMDGKEQTNGET